MNAGKLLTRNVFAEKRRAVTLSQTTREKGTTAIIEIFKITIRTHEKGKTWLEAKLKMTEVQLDSQWHKFVSNVKFRMI